MITRLAEAHGRTPGQIVLRWHVEIGTIAIPKSANPERQRQNLEIFDFELSADDLTAIAELDRGDEGVTDSEQFGH